ncbi:MAG: hypothetical protein IRZ09_00070 [Variibacter sp.]|nr:hypothetical protein [Variibacter sp.]
MTTLTFPANARFAEFLRGVCAFFANLIEGIREGLEIRDRYERLSRLSDSELKRHGLDRSQIALAAVRGIDAR